MKTWVLVGRITGSVVMTVLLLLVAFVIAVVGQAQYLEDYCFTRVDVPAEATGGRGLIPEGPITYRCQWDGARDLTITEPAPLGWVLIASSAAGVVASWLWLGLVIRPCFLAKAGTRWLVWERLSVTVLGLVLTAVPAGLVFVWAWSPTLTEILTVVPLLLPAALLALAGASLVHGERRGQEPMERGI